ncbi:MAG: DsrE family protein [Deferribacteres bacterium]|nr:DsrE family protein [Deferribacteres bacterium]
MAKKITLILNTSPYNYENTYTAMKIAEAALDRGLDTHLVASTDGVYCFLKGQAGKGLPNAAGGFRALMDRGLKVSL